MSKPQEPQTFLERMHSRELNWVCYVPLFFSLFYFVPFLHHVFLWHQYIVMLLGYGVFVMLYTLCRIRPERAGLYIFLMALLTVELSYINWMAYSLVWFGLYYAGYLFSLRKVVLINLLVMPCLLVSWSFTTMPIQVYMMFAILPCAALSLIGMFDQRVKKEEAVKREKNNQIENLATIAERERLARDMHDVLGHNLTAICLKSRVASKLGRAGDMVQALTEIEEIANLASTALSDVREAISEYKRRGLSEQLSVLTKKLEDAGFQVETNIAAEKLNAKDESNLILVLTEAVTNILRHSEGDKVNIKFECIDEQVRLEVSDNGSVEGFKAGNGIKGIRERIAELGGSVEVYPHDGFTMQVTI